jgi:hypothetical protein
MDAMVTAYFDQLSQASPTVQLEHMIAGSWISQAIGVATELGIADLLVDGPQSVAKLAEQTGSHQRSLYRLLRALASVGVFSEIEPKTCWSRRAGKSAPRPSIARCTRRPASR